MPKNVTTTWWTYVRQVAGTPNTSEIARRVGVSPATVTRWRQSRPQPEQVIRFALAYEVDLLEAFREAYDPPAELLRRYPLASLADWTPEQLWYELLARTDRRDREALVQQMLADTPSPLPGGDDPEAGELGAQTA